MRLSEHQIILIYDSSSPGHETPCCYRKSVRFILPSPISEAHALTLTSPFSPRPRLPILSSHAVFKPTFCMHLQFPLRKSRSRPFYNF